MEMVTNLFTIFFFPNDFMCLTCGVGTVLYVLLKKIQRLLPETGSKMKFSSPILTKRMFNLLGGCREMCSFFFPTISFSCQLFELFSK